MANRRKPSFKVGHPAPDRRRVATYALLLGLAGAPLAWSLQLLAGSAVSGAACIAPDGSAVPHPNFDWTYPVLIGTNAAALLLSFLALGLAYRSYRQTGHGEADAHGDVMDAGEGRTRFLSIWGIWTSVLFLLAITANTIAVFWTGLCAAS